MGFGSMILIVIVILSLALLQRMIASDRARDHDKLELEQEPSAPPPVKRTARPEPAPRPKQALTPSEEQALCEVYAALCAPLASALEARRYTLYNSPPSDPFFLFEATHVRGRSFSIEATRFGTSRAPYIAFMVRLEHDVGSMRVPGGGWQGDDPYIDLWGQRLVFEGVMERWGEPLQRDWSGRRDRAYEYEIHRGEVGSLQITTTLRYKLREGREASARSLIEQLLDDWGRMDARFACEDAEGFLWEVVETPVVPQHWSLVHLLLERSHDETRRAALVRSILEGFASPAGEVARRWAEVDPQYELLVSLSDAQIDEALLEDGRAGALWVHLVAQGRQRYRSVEGLDDVRDASSPPLTLWRLALERGAPHGVTRTLWDDLILALARLDDTTTLDATAALLYACLEQDASAREVLLQWVAAQVSAPFKALRVRLWAHVSATPERHGALIEWCWSARVLDALPGLPDDEGERLELCEEIITLILKHDPIDSLRWTTTHPQQAELLVAQRDHVQRWDRAQYERASLALWRPSWSAPAQPTDALLSQMWLHAPTDLELRSDLLELLKRHGAAASLAALRHVASNGPDLPRAIDARAEEVADRLEVQVGSQSSHDGMLTLSDDGVSGGLSIANDARGGLSAHEPS